MLQGYVFLFSTMCQQFKRNYEMDCLQGQGNDLLNVHTLKELKSLFFLSDIQDLNLGAPKGQAFRGKVPTDYSHSRFIQ